MVDVLPEENRSVIMPYVSMTLMKDREVLDEAARSLLEKGLRPTCPVHHSPLILDGGGRKKLHRTPILEAIQVQGVQPEVFLLHHP